MPVPELAEAKGLEPATQRHGTRGINKATQFAAAIPSDPLEIVRACISSKHCCAALMMPAMSQKRVVSQLFYFLLW